MNIIAINPQWLDLCAVLGYLAFAFFVMWQVFARSL